MNEDESYMAPSELSWHLEKQGLKYSTRYFRGIRRYGLRIQDTPFVGNLARPTDVREWLKRHPEFTIRLGETKIECEIAGL